MAWGEICGSSQEVVAKCVEVLFAWGPVNVAAVFFFFAVVADEMLGDEVPFIGGADGRGGFCGEAEDADGSAKRGALGGAGEVFLQDVECAGGGGANAVGVIEPERFALAVKLSAEGGVIETPSGDGAAIEADGVGGMLVGLAV